MFTIGSFALFPTADANFVAIRIDHRKDAHVATALHGGDGNPILFEFLMNRFDIVACDKEIEIGTFRFAKGGRLHKRYPRFGRGFARLQLLRQRYIAINRQDEQDLHDFLSTVERKSCKSCQM